MDRCYLKGQQGNKLLQTIAHQRYELRRSIVITSNRVVQAWGKYLADATMATTILDLLMHCCAMLDFGGKNYRLKDAAPRIAKPLIRHNPEVPMEVLDWP